jgi:hypothetical protein
MVGDIMKNEFIGSNSLAPEYVGIEDETILETQTPEDPKQTEVSEEKPTTAKDLMFIFAMVKSIRRGDWGTGDDQIDNLSMAGFGDDQILSLQAAAEV